MLAPWDLRAGHSRLQCLEIGDDVLTIVVAGHADDHLGAVNVGAGILNKLVERLLIPGDGSRLEGGRVVEPGFGSALRPNTPASDGPILFTRGSVAWQMPQAREYLRPAAALRRQDPSTS
jgi:hypothetical protein